MIICVTGLAGSGKSTFSLQLKQKLEKRGKQVFYITSDMTARDIFLKYRNLPADLDIDYTSEELAIIYNSMFYVFSLVLQANPKAVILTDGAYRYTALRLRLKLLCNQLNTTFKLIKIESDVQLAKQRITERVEKGGHGGWIDPREYEDITVEPAVFVQNNNGRQQLLHAAERIAYQITGY